MSSWSIQKYMAGLKNQTRRTKGLDKINENPDEWRLNGILFASGKAMFTNVKNSLLHHVVTLPYGIKGDTLYFKETYRPCQCERCNAQYSHGAEPFHEIEYRADGDDPHGWKSSMFMSQKYARFRDIPILNVRVERLHDITKEDVMGEGIEHTKDGEWLGVDGYPFAHAHEAYDSIWDSINGKKLPSSKNPWLFVYDFPFYDDAWERAE